MLTEIILGSKKSLQIIDMFIPLRFLHFLAWRLAVRSRNSHEPTISVNLNVASYLFHLREWNKFLWSSLILIRATKLLEGLWDFLSSCDLCHSWRSECQPASCTSHPRSHKLVSLINYTQDVFFFLVDEGVKPCLTTPLHQWKQNSNFTVMSEAFLKLISGFRETSQHLNCRHATALASVERVR